MASSQKPRYNDLECLHCLTMLISWHGVIVFGVAFQQWLELECETLGLKCPQDAMENVEGARAVLKAIHDVQRAMGAKANSHVAGAPHPNACGGSKAKAF